MDRRGSEWRLVHEESYRGPMNMALDEVAAASAAAGGPRTLRVYRWEPSTLSLGYHQDPTTVDWEFCECEGITVTRRPTGGGGIYHDSYGDISYSIVAPADELPGDLMETYELLCEPIFDAFDRLGVAAEFADEPRPEIHRPACYLRELHPAHDVVAGGRKLSGNAQYRRRDAVIQHGSITFESRPERHLSTFSKPETTPKEFTERVTSLKEEGVGERERAVEALEGALKEWVDAEDGAWTDDEMAAARERADGKFASEAWNHNGEDPLARSTKSKEG
ncbi:lipoate--protein ligase family protein [Halalkalicoccus jeotgali]|uniref:Biotin/lipoate A/B protein ligase n=1 Tax=Halalkalicoccus jeotgali (strain DSM 18796 / CECT 7217 / JCM 14584 / KCTC 4019 / B3) TaxID=795797 RepID=D8J7T5_HALJB|nr:biotin/lipoate A/B protein ligase family protein [Halalkalicoccus jeotgali]ADJ16105.1 lipoate-protein ligase [Halalkalicoccus jeotgali B3]ELY38200.1 biotin/lipoate A/B protein ligase [Halalkalicoccus jeotgali B3]